MGSCAEKQASCGVRSTGSLHPSAARQPVPPRSARPATLCTHGTHYGQVRVRGCNLTGKGCTVCAAARNLGSFVLDDVFRRRKIRAQGFMLLDGGSMHGLSRRNNALSDRMDRASSSSFPESSAARFCDFSSHFTALATHMSLKLGESLHHSLQLCVHGIPVADHLVSRFLRSGTLLLLLLHVLSSATSCTVSCFRTVSATLDTDFSFVALIIWTSRARDQHCRLQLVRRNFPVAITRTLRSTFLHYQEITNKSNH